MPTDYIKKLAKKKKRPVEELEKLWDKAKELAKENGHDEEYDYITGIFKKMIGESLSFKEFLVIVEDGEPTMSVANGGTVHHAPTDGGNPDIVTRKNKKKKKKESLEEHI